MADAANSQNGRDILFETLPENPAAHGPDDDEQRGLDLQMVLRPHARFLAAAAGMSTVLALKAIGRRT